MSIKTHTEWWERRKDELNTRTIQRRTRLTKETKVTKLTISLLPYMSLSGLQQVTRAVSKDEQEEHEELEELEELLFCGYELNESGTPLPVASALIFIGLDSWERYCC